MQFTKPLLFHMLLLASG